MNKFKVGDRVKLIEVPELRNRTWYKNNFGKTMTVKRATGWSVDVVENPFSWNEMWLTAFAPDRHELHITSDGTTTNAVYKLNGKVAKTAKAVCCPSDTFNFNTGAELAINRVLYGTDYNPREVAFKEPMQNEPKEAVTLYCVKDYVNVIEIHALHKGKIYEFDGQSVNYDGMTCAKFSSFENWKSCDPSYAACLIRAEKRQAKVGEWVVTLHETDNVPKGSVKEVLSVNWCGSKNIRVMPDCEGGILPPSGYLVLLDYIPEKVEPTYFSGKVVCVDVGETSKWWTKGKVYTYKDGYTTADNGEISPCGTPAITNIEELENYGSVKFIEYRGEQSC